MSGVAIRPAGPLDLPDIARLLADFERHLNAIDPAEATAVTDAERRALAAFMLGPRPSRAVLLATRDAAPDAPPVGFLAFQTIAWMDDGAPALWMSDLCVSAGARGAGVGRALIEAARDEARARGARRLVFTVWRKNDAARAFYERLAAQEIGGEILLGIAV